MKLIRAGRLIDGTGAAVQRERAVVVDDDGVIVSVGPAGETPADVELVDLSGVTVLPGLIDCHVHLVFSHTPDPVADLVAEDDQQLLLRTAAGARQALGGGITTVRDLGGRGGVTFRVRDAINAGLLEGPRILAAGSPITITGGHCHFLGLEADGEAAVRTAARRMVKSGANCLKIMATGGRMTPISNVGVAQYSVAEIKAAVDEAHRSRITIAAHAIGTAGIRNAVEAGVNTIEHCSWLGPEGTVEFDERTAASMAEKGIAASPTLLPVKLAGLTTSNAVSAGVRQHLAVREEILSCLRRMVTLGVPFVGATDAGVAWTPFDSLPGELELLVSEVGLTPLQAITAATGTAARILGLSATLGTLTAGRTADLVAVEGDPSVRIEDLRAVHTVIKGGKLVVENGAFVSQRTSLPKMVA